MIGRTPLLLLFGLALTGSGMQGVAGIEDAAARQRLSRLLTVAITYDLYNGRCRGFLSSMHADNVETLTVEKFGMTLSQLADALASKPLTALRRDAGNALMKQILALGGCRAAKRSGYLKQLQNDYQQLYDWLAGYP